MSLGKLVLQAKRGLAACNQWVWLGLRGVFAFIVIQQHVKPGNLELERVRLCPNLIVYENSNVLLLFGF